MPSCDIFLGIRSIFWDSGENLLMDATKIPGICVFLVDDRENSQEIPGFLVCPGRFS